MMMNMINAESKQNLTIAFESYSRNLIENVVSHLSIKYNFDMEEALSSLYPNEDRKEDREEDHKEDRKEDLNDQLSNSESDLETVTEDETVKDNVEVEQSEVNELDKRNTKPNEIPFIKTSYTIPYYGQVYDTCYGIKTNHDLFTQCSNKRIKNASHNYCKTCLKQSQENSHGFPNAGNIMQRIQCKPHEYRDPRKKLSKPYGAFLKKMKLSRQDVENEFKEHGIVIPEELWVETWPKNSKKNSKKQHPKKQKKPFTPKVTVSDSEEEKESEEQVTEPVTEPVTKPVTKPVIEPVTEPENTEILKLQTIEVEGQQFLLSEDNIVYDVDTEEEIGVFEDGNIELN